MAETGRHDHVGGNTLAWITSRRQAMTTSRPRCH